MTSKIATPEEADAVLSVWLAREEAVRGPLAQGAGAGVIGLEQVAHIDGLHTMQAMMQGQLPYPAMAQTLDFMLVEVARGQAVFQGIPGTAHLNPMGSVHGGWYASVLDSALGCAVHTMMPVGRSYTTTQLSVTLVRAISKSVQRVRAQGQVLHCGRQLATAEAQLLGPDGTLYAHATATCLVFDLVR